MKKKVSLSFWIYVILISCIANSYMLLPGRKNLLPFLILLYLLINCFAGTVRPKIRSNRLKICHHGLQLLLIFVASTVCSIVYQIILAIVLLPTGNYISFLWSAAQCIGAEALLFWNGIICVYLTSYQLGVKRRVVGILLGLVPILNLFLLRKIIKTVQTEIDYEIQKEKLNLDRAELSLCKTKYPILMVHGVFFRDSKHFNYWGRIPKELEINGATIFYGNHQSAASIQDSAAELSQRIKEIIREHGCEKINIIAHSKGGLDCRYAMSDPDIAAHIASLTTINTPHRGCLFADYLLTKIPQDVKDNIAEKYNIALKKLGDPTPDFMAAVNNLTASHCTELDASLENPEGVFCQSVGSIVNKASGGKFPLNFSYHLVKFFDGDNDGLVSEPSFQWGEKYQLLTPIKKRGISHADMIDLNRENIEGFDVREYYVGLVNDLKERGL